MAWISTFLAAAIGCASVLLAVWGVLLIVDPAELVHYEYAIPMLIVAAVGACVSVVLWRVGSRERT
jgi:hypothetical protein